MKKKDPANVVTSNLSRKVICMNDFMQALRTQMGVHQEGPNQSRLQLQNCRVNSFAQSQRFHAIILYNFSIWQKWALSAISPIYIIASITHYHCNMFAVCI